MRALALGVHEGGGMPAEPCAMVLIGQGGNGAAELIDVRCCSGDSRHSWSEVLGDLGRRGLRWPGMIEVGGAAREFAHAWESASPGAESAVRPVRLQEVQNKPGAVSGVLRIADEFAHGCGKCGHGRCTRRSVGRNAADDAGWQAGVVHHF